MHRIDSSEKSFPRTRCQLFALPNPTQNIWDLGLRHFQFWDLGFGPLTPRIHPYCGMFNIAESIPLPELILPILGTRWSLDTKEIQQTDRVQKFPKFLPKLLLVSPSPSRFNINSILQYGLFLIITSMVMMINLLVSQLLARLGKKPAVELIYICLLYLITHRINVCSNYLL